MISRVRNLFLIFSQSYHVSGISKIQVNFRYRRYLKILLIVSYKFLTFSHYLCFWGWGIHLWYSYWATIFLWPRKSRSTSGTGDTWRYWWLFLMNFWNFFTIYVFEGEESIPDFLTELPCFGDLKTPGQLPVQEVLMIVSYEFLKFLHYLCFRGWVIHSWFSNWATMFRWPRKSRSTSGIGGTWRYWWLRLMNFWNVFTIYVFEDEESISDILTELTHFGVPENLGQLPVQEVLMILSIEFLKFSQYLCFRGQEFHCWHSYWATLFGWPQKPLEPEVDPDFRGHPNKVAE